MPTQQTTDRTPPVSQKAAHAKILTRSPRRDDFKSFVLLAHESAPGRARRARHDDICPCGRTCWAWFWCYGHCVRRDDRHQGALACGECAWTDAANCRR
jgi:hypothetical protein